MRLLLVAFAFSLPFADVGAFRLPPSRPSGLSSPAIRKVPVVALPTRPASLKPQPHHRQSSPSSLAALQEKAAFWVVGSVLGGCTGTPVVVKATKTWYRRLDLPSFTPPDAVFAPVWTTLYALIGYSGWKVYSKLGGLNNPAMILFSSHYLLNLAWAPAFFGFKRLRLAQGISYAMLGTLVGVMHLFRKVSVQASALLLPYLCWLSFATYLNRAICKMNPTKGGYNNAKLESDMEDMDRLRRDLMKMT